jgi:hypothetical protein
MERAVARRDTNGTSSGCDNFDQALVCMTHDAFAQQVWIFYLYIFCSEV